MGANLYSGLFIYFTKVSFSPQAFSPENEEISAPPPCGLLIGIYLFYENWSTETFRKKESKKWAVCSTYKSLLGAILTNSRL
jgi:hypothetical protein